MKFRKTHIDIAQEELDDARMKLLKALTGLEWAQAEVTFRRDQTKRLEAYIKSEKEKAND